jgi:hypothetical protein
MTRVRDTQPKAGDAKQGSARERPDGEAGTPNLQHPHQDTSGEHNHG